MRFLIENSLVRETEEDGLRVTGFVVLEVREGEQSLCWRKFNINFHSDFPDLGQRCAQSLDVWDGSDHILSEEGFLDENHETAPGENNRFAFGLFMNQVVQYLEQGTPLCWNINEDDFSEPVRDSFLRFCQGVPNRT